MNSVLSSWKKVVFFPTTESHTSCFIPLYQELNKKTDIAATFLVVEEAIPFGRTFTLDSEISRITTSLDQVEKTCKKIGSIDLLFVGNDAAPAVYKVIRICRRFGAKVVMYQDGWLDSSVIRQPLHLTKGRFPYLKKIAHKLLVSRFSPLKNKIYGFIGQHADFFFVYSEVARQNFIKAGVSSAKLFITGSTRHSIIRKEALNAQSSVQPKIDACVFFSRPEFSTTGDKAILTALKWVISICKEKYIVIKLHPSEDGSRYQQILKEHNNVSLFTSSIKDLFEEFRVSWAFCFNSTVVFDMLLLDIPIIQLAPVSMMEKKNYHMDLPLAQGENDLSREIEKYDLVRCRQIGARYLADINPQFNSIEVAMSVLFQLLKDN